MLCVAQQIVVEMQAALSRPVSSAGKRAAAARVAETDDVNDLSSQRSATSTTLQDPRRELRSEYRSEIEKLSGAQLKSRHAFQAASIENIAALSNVLDRADDLSKRVAFTREASLDAELILQASEIGLRQASSISSSGARIDIADALAKLKAKLELDRSALGKWATNALPLSSQCATFLYGPMDVELKEKEKRKVVRQRDVIAEQKKIGRMEDQGESQRSETTKRVEQLYEYLGKYSEGINFWRFIWDPTSYSNTGHNLFHLSFLVKDGHAIVFDKNGEPWISRADPPTEEDYNNGRATRKQAVISFTYEQWVALCDQFGDAAPVLPSHGSQQQTQRVQTASSSRDNSFALVGSQSSHPSDMMHGSQPSQHSQKMMSRLKTKRASKRKRDSDSEEIPDENESEDRS